MSSNSFLSLDSSSMDEVADADVDATVGVGVSGVRMEEGLEEIPGIAGGHTVLRSAMSLAFSN